MAVSVLGLFLTMPRAGLQCVMVACPGHTHFFIFDTYFLLFCYSTMNYYAAFEKNTLEYILLGYTRYLNCLMHV